MSQENVEVIRLLGERHDAGDRAGVLELIHPDFELFPPEYEPEAKGVYRGREGWLEYDAYWDKTFTHWDSAGRYITAAPRVAHRHAEFQLDASRAAGVGGATSRGHPEGRPGLRSRHFAAVGDRTARCGEPPRLHYLKTGKSGSLLR